jgi:predicted permease
MPELRDEVRRRLAGANLEPARRLEILEEIAQDLEERYQELLARGAAPADAEAQVLAQLSTHDALARGLAEAMPPAPRPPPVAGEPRGNLGADLWSDLRFGVRALLKTPGFTAVTILSLALGVGANTAIFQMLAAVHLRPLPVASPGELALITIEDKGFRSGSHNSWHADLTNPQWEELRDTQQAFSSLVAWGDASFNLSPSGEIRPARGIYVSGGFFTTLGVPPLLGRVLTPADDRRGCGAPGAVLSHGFWQRELGGDPGAVGRRLSLDGHEVEILGVTPASFTGLEVGRAFDVAVPLCMEPLFRDRSRLDQRNGYWLSAIGRLAPGWTLERARAHLVAISPGIFESTVPEEYTPERVAKYKAYTFVAHPGATGISALRAEYGRPLLFLLITAGLVLLIACANLANLLLARAAAREREIAVRLALGASRGRLVRQLMTESLLLAAFGAAAGLWLATTLGGLMVRYLSTRDRPLFVDLAADGRVLGFTLGLAVLTCLLFGLAPALRASRTDLGVVLKATGGHGTTVARLGLRRLLVAAQVALSFVLLVGALLFARSLDKLASVDPGFDESGVILLGVDLRRMDPPVERRAALHEAIVERVRAVPGVAAAASVGIVPISGSGWNNSMRDAARTEEQQKSENVWLNRVSSGYFATLGTPLLAGRDFGPGDKLGAPVVGVVNETVASKLFGGENPVGRRLRSFPGDDGKEWMIEIVGVVKDSKYRELKEPSKPIVYVAAAQEKEPWPGVDLVIRRAAPLRDVVGGVKAAVAEVAPRAALDIDLLERMIRESLLRERLVATLSGFFGVLAAILATIGLYGVVAYGVARRTHEIGVRMALGASRRAITAMIVRENGLLLLIGLGAGVLLALAAGRAAASMLYGLAPHDPVTFLLAIALMGGVTLIAGALPARRAARVDPMIALKDE